MGSMGLARWQCQGGVVEGKVAGSCSNRKAASTRGEEATTVSATSEIQHLTELEGRGAKGGKRV